MKWDSPWGVGYPGWHIECSAMATRLLDRPQIDIHTGGEDNIFPHHECEIAQTCGATGEDAFARFWMHARFLLVEGEKMSKSKGNFYTVRDLINGTASPTGQSIDPAVIRFELLRTHYRQNMNFTAKGLHDAGRAVERLRSAAEEARSAVGDQAPPPVDDHAAVTAFQSALAADLNTSGAIGEVFSYLSDPDDDAAIHLGVLEAFDRVLGVLATSGEAAGAADEDVEARCRELDAARTEKNYEAADAIRQELEDAGYDVQTTPEGTVA